MSQVNLMQSVEITHKLLMKHTDTKPEKGKNNRRERKSHLLNEGLVVICPFSAILKMPVI